jgi:hypothetical protein
MTEIPASLNKIFGETTKAKLSELKISCTAPEKKLE